MPPSGPPPDPHHPDEATLADLELLCRAPQHSALDPVYWRLENKAIVEGVLQPIARPMAAAGVLGLARCARRGVPFLLELLQQMTSADEAPLDPPAGYHALVAAVEQEIVRGYPLYMSHLAGGDPTARLISIDLLGLCGSLAPELAERIRAALREHVLARPGPEGREVAAFWIRELSNGQDGDDRWTSI
ncbi:MAG: hypothetical protein H6739_39645 [Alphaproteobacteria bacterium]|nr:hypothetical protein [Alphaproteobacteria bacterium]